MLDLNSKTPNLVVQTTDIFLMFLEVNNLNETWDFKPGYVVCTLVCVLVVGSPKASSPTAF
jgi:hypothetical protein